MHTITSVAIKHAFVSTLTCLDICSNDFRRQVQTQVNNKQWAIFSIQINNYTHLNDNLNGIECNERGAARERKRWLRTRSCFSFLQRILYRFRMIHAVSIPGIYVLKMSCNTEIKHQPNQLLQFLFFFRCSFMRDSVTRFHQNFAIIKTKHTKIKSKQ